MRRPQCPACGDEALYRADRATGSGAAAAESEGCSQQRRPALGVSGGDPRQVPPPGEPRERGRDVARAHHGRDRSLAARPLGRGQPGAPDPEAELAAAEPAEQERGQGKHAGAIRGERALRGAGALLGRLPWRRDPRPETFRGLRRGRGAGGDPPERGPALQRPATGRRGSDQRPLPPVQRDSAASRPGSG